MKNKTSFVLMYIAFLVYSFSGICAKLASMQEFLSLQYILSLAGIVLILGIYALMWQQVLRKIQLSIAMSNKPIVLVFTTLWAVLFFGESLDVKFFIGMIFIIVGLFVIGSGNE